MKAFSGFRAQEFSSGRNIEKQIANGDRCAARVRRISYVAHAPTFDDDLCRGYGSFTFRNELDARYRGDRGQGFPAKTERRNSLKILGRADFRRGVTLEGQHRVVTHHSLAII